jgi:hypothetical protein
VALRGLYLLFGIIRGIKKEDVIERLVARVGKRKIHVLCGKARRKVTTWKTWTQRGDNTEMDLDA